MLVTQNCAAALRRLRVEDNPRIVWIDSICIDQTEITERNHQLGLMAKIYTQAERVVIHLGESSDDSDLAIEYLRQIDDPDFDGAPHHTGKERVVDPELRLVLQTNHKSDDASPAEQRIIRPDTRILESLLRRPWFNRIWVLQEAVLSKTAVVYCGQKTISWDAIKHFKEFNTSTKWVEHMPYVIGRRQLTAVDNFSVEYQVLTELLKARHCESTDPRDKIYALLPLLSHAGINPDIIPNYGHSAARVYTDVATYLMNSIGLELLCAVNAARSQLPSLPSWVPDWSIRVQRQAFGLQRYTSFKAGGEFVIPSRNTGQEVLPFTIDRVDQSGILTAHIRTKAFHLGYIQAIGDPCADDAEIPPLRQWKSLSSTIGVLGNLANKVIPEFKPGAGTSSSTVSAAGTVPIPSANDRRDGRAGDIFEYTVVAGDVVYPSILKRAVERFVTDDGSEKSKIPIREWMKGLPPSFRRQLERLLHSCRGRRFLVLDTGYIGLAPLEAESGDHVFIIPGVSVPFVLREENGGLRLVGECYVQNVMDGEVMADLDASRLEDIIIE